jgi:branched-chain amino acid transport system ATP-binding protein
MDLLDVQQVVKRFGGLQAINGVSLQVPAGRLLGVIGPNGAGKTTLLNLITGYLRPNAGQVVFDGEPITGLPPYQVCMRGIARTFQVVQPFHEMTVAENVLVGSLFTSGRKLPTRQVWALAEETLERVGLHPKAGALAGALTYGEKKKLELARALASRPRLLLLDEVMAGLTRQEIDSMCEILQRIHREGVTVIMVEHLVQVILALCEEVFVLNFGERLFQGAPREVMEHPEVIESYLGRPLGDAPARV